MWEKAKHNDFSDLLPDKGKHRKPEEIDLDEDSMHPLFMEMMQDVIAQQKEQGATPKLRAGWDDCEISDSAWERFMQKHSKKGGGKNDNAISDQAGANSGSPAQGRNERAGAGEGDGNF